MPRGPLPDPNHRHRGAPAIPTTSLPASGRGRPAPEVPQPATLGRNGMAWWSWAWSTPQAAAWDDGSHMTLARRAALEDIEPTLAVMKEMRELDDRYGLTPKGLAALRWKIVDDAPAEQTKPSGRPRLVAVDNTATG